MSFYTALTGLNGSQADIAATSNNIANVATTGYKRSSIKLIDNIIPYEEIFVGSNYKNYKHKYYIAYMPEIDDTMKYQKSEISNMEWKTHSSCLESIREYNLEKLSILKNINNVLNLYRIYD